MDNKTLLKTIADNPSLKQALRELLDKQFTLENLALTGDDITLGQSVRGRLVAMQGISAAFKEIEQYASNPEPERDQHPGR